MIDIVLTHNGYRRPYSHNCEGRPFPGPPGAGKKSALGYRRERFAACVCRKLDSAILMVKAAKDSS